MDSNEALGIMNARQQVRLVKKLREIRENLGLSVEKVAELMQRDRMDAVTGADFVREFEAGGMNYSAAVLRSYAKAVGAELDLDAFLPKGKLSERVYEVAQPANYSEWRSSPNGLKIRIENAVV